MTGRAYMGEVLTQVWLKSIKKWVSYLTKKWTHKKRIWKKFFRGSRKLLQAHDKSVRWKWNKKKKNDGRLKYFCGQEGVYRTRVESSCNGYQTTSAQRFLIHWRYYLFSKQVNRCQGMVFRAWAYERRHKTRNGWYSGLVAPISSIVGLLILYGWNVLSRW